MIPLTLKQNPQPEPPKVSIDMAEQIADRAARKAAVDVSRENMESFNRFQDQNKPIQSQPETTETIVDDDPGVDLFDKTTANSITKTVRAFKSMQEVFAPPPDPIRSAMENGISQMAAKFVESTLLGGGGGGIVKKSSFIIDVMNTAAAHGFGESLGNNLPQVIQSLSGAIGQKKTQELVDNINSKMTANSGTINSSSGNENDGSSNVEKQKDMVLALDSNNIEHVKQYASAMGLSEKAAKGMLQIHQDDILSDRKGNVQGNNPNSNSNTNVGNIEIVQAIGTLIQEMTGMKNTINSLQSEISNIRSKKVDEDVGVTEPESADRKWTDEDEQINVSKSPISVTQKSVTLFSTPIKVDVDSIKGDTNSFFNDKPTDNINKNINANVKANSINKKEEIEKESVLEEVIDDEGKSTFKMSDSNDQHKNITENVVNEKKDEKEDDKKKESGFIELENSMMIDKSEDVEIVEKIEETPKIDKKIVRKKIIRKSVPIEEVQEIQESIPSHITEHYDINNNLVTEDKIQ